MKPDASRQHKPGSIIGDHETMSMCTGAPDAVTRLHAARL